jgi:hypothetical protein
LTIGTIGTLEPLEPEAAFKIESFK